MHNKLTFAGDLIFLACFCEGVGDNITRAGSRSGGTEDTYGSGPYGRKPVWVQIPPSAPVEMSSCT